MTSTIKLDLGDAAIELALQGLKVFPCRPDKSPYTKNGYHNATDELDKIADWWNQWPGALIGLPCKPNNIIAVDIDNKNGQSGDQEWEQLVQKHGASDPVRAGWVQTTKNGGSHLIFRHPEIEQAKSKLAAGIDIRSNAYVIIAPSPGYQWADGLSPGNSDLVYPPKWLTELIKKEPEVSSPGIFNQDKPGNVDHWLEKYTALARPGQRDEICYSMCQQMFWDGIPIGEARAALPYFISSIPGGDHPYTLREAERACRSAYTSQPRRPAAKTGAIPMTSSHTEKKIQKASFIESDTTDTANADRFAAQHEGEVCWVSEMGWMCFTGQLWERDKNNTVTALAKDTARSIYREAADAEDDKHAKALAGWASRTLAKSKLDAMVSLAASELPADIQEFDMERMLLNVQNGTLNLRTGTLQPHNPDDRITKVAGTSYDPEAQCQTWLSFLDKVTKNDDELIEFLQRSVGYSITGSVSEQCLFFLHGNGANGKSTFIQAILSVLGDYAIQAAPMLLMMGNRHPTEIADLSGRRFAATIEVEEGRRLAEVLTKQLTGGDRIKARYMRRDFFEFEPSFKLWLSANHKPVIRGTDKAIWRRIKLVPFTVTIPEDEQDPYMLDRLKTELPGILAWAVQGCLMWQRDRLKTPERVQVATRLYQAEMDVMAAFFEDKCVLDQKCEAGASDLYHAYTSWCDDNGEKAWAQRTFGMKLAERGFEKRRLSGGNIWEGIGIKE